jgi:Zn-dependent protease
MRYTLGFGTYFGIPVRIHFTFPLILVAFGLEAGIRGGWEDAAVAILLVLAVFVCVVLHEFGHSLQVLRYGIRVRDIVLLPIGGMARAESIPERPRQEIIVAISGPLVNYALALLLFGVLWIRGSAEDPLQDFIVTLLSINLVLGTFNLVPAFPMDGGRILRGLLATRMPYLRATQYAKNTGQVIALLFVVAGFWDTQLIMLPLIAVFVFFGGISEERMVRVRVNLAGKSVRDFVPPHVPVLQMNVPARLAAEQVGTVNRAALPVTDAQGTLVGIVETSDIDGLLRDGRGEEPIARFVRTGFPLIDGDTEAAQAYHLLRSQRVPLAGVMGSGRYLGLVYYEDLALAAG